MAGAGALLLASQSFELAKMHLLGMLALRQSIDRTTDREDNAISRVRLRKRATDLLKKHLDISSLARKMREVFV